MTKVLNVTTHAIDLDDGRTLAPGETADDIKEGNRHNKTLIEQGLILVVDDEAAPDPEPDPDDPPKVPKSAPENTTNREDKKS